MGSGSKFCKVLEILSCARRCPTYVINITLVELRLVSLVVFKHLPLNIANEETSIVFVPIFVPILVPMATPPARW